MAAKRVRFQATECTNDIDLVSQTGWAEEAPSIFIAFPGRDPSAPRKIMCYNGPKLAQWILDKNNTFARWVQKRIDKPMEDTGHYGARSDDPRERYWKLYTGEFVLVDKVIQEIITSETPYIFDADPIGIERVGNLAGTFGVSMLHGQAPGVTIYELSNPQRVQVVSNPEVDALRDLSFLDLIKKVPLELVDKYPAAVLMAARDAYLDEQYQRHAHWIIDNAKEIMDKELKTFIAFNVEMNGEEYEFLRQSAEVPSMFSSEGDLALERTVDVKFSLILNSSDKWEFNCVSSQKSFVLNSLTQRVSNLRMVNDIFEFLLRYMPGSNNITVVGTTMAALLGDDFNDLYEGVIKKYDKYFTTKNIEYVLGIVPSVETTKLYDDHGPEILDRLLQLVGRKPLEEKPAAKKKAKVGKKKTTKSKSVARNYTADVNRAFDEQTIALLDDLVPTQRRNYLPFVTAVRDALRNHPVLTNGFRNGVDETVFSNFIARVEDEEDIDDVDDVLQEIFDIFNAGFAPAKAKSPKATSPSKARSPKVVKAKATTPSAWLVEAFRLGDAGQVVGAFPRSSDDYAQYFESILYLMDTDSANLTPQFAGRLFAALTPIRARLVPAANYAVETDLLTDIRQRLLQITEGVVPKAAKAKVVSYDPSTFSFYHSIVDGRNVADIVDAVIAGDVSNQLRRLRDAVNEVIDNGIDINRQWSNQLIAALRQAFEEDEAIEDIIDRIENTLLFFGPSVKTKAAKKTVKAKSPKKTIPKAKSPKVAKAQTMVDNQTLVRLDRGDIHIFSRLLRSTNPDDELLQTLTNIDAALSQTAVTWYVATRLSPLVREIERETHSDEIRRLAVSIRGKLAPYAAAKSVAKKAVGGANSIETLLRSEDIEAFTVLLDPSRSNNDLLATLRNIHNSLPNLTFNREFVDELEQILRQLLFRDGNNDDIVAELDDIIYILRDL